MERESTSFDELARRIRERGVRVEERLSLLRLLEVEDPGRYLAERRDELLAEVRRSATRLRTEALV